MFEYSIGDFADKKAIGRQIFGVLPLCVFNSSVPLKDARNYQDLWWHYPAGSESGWGLNLTQQESKIFATWFTYDRDQQPVWFSATTASSGDRRFSGDLVATTGPPFNSRQFDASTVTAAVVGTVDLQFDDGNTGTIKVNADGKVLTKPITREVFREPGTTCL